jgi:hypothetical protein
MQSFFKSLKFLKSMKKIFISLVVLFTASLSFAQAPAKPAVETAKAAPAKVKEAAKPAMETSKTAPADAAKAAPKVKKAKMMAKPAASTSAPTMEVDSAKAAPVKMKKAKKMAVAATSTAMTFKCPKGDAISDGGGKCPRCGTEMVAMEAAAAPKKAAKKAAKMEKVPAKVEEKKG